MRSVFLLAVSTYVAFVNAEFLSLKELHLEKAIEEGYNSYETEIGRGSFKYYVNKISGFSEGMGLMRPNVGHPPCECGKCVKGVVGHIMGSVFEHIHQFCNKTKCPVMQKHCEEMKEHKGETLGYLIGAVRPFEKGFAYCFGKGECPHPHCPRSEDVASSNAVVASEETCEEIMTTEDEQYVREDLDSLLDGILETAPEIVPEFDFENVGEDKCRSCIGKVAKFVFGKTAERIKHKCEETKCPFMKRKCEMAKRHPHVAAGLLWYKLRPGEFGCGFCIGHGVCTKKDDVKTSLIDIPKLEL